MSTPRMTVIPPLLYGTAWKKERTQTLVRNALTTGFLGVDTAAQRKHYREDLVGAGIRDVLEAGVVQRRDIYIQTKFTSTHGQDLHGPLPYDPTASITDQVNASVASSLHNLRPSPQTSAISDIYLDCLVLHSPFPKPGDTQEAWRAMEAHVPHSIRMLGISNIYHLPALQSLYEFATVKPVVVQNRFYADSGYDKSIRDFCAQNGITYQSFWTLTANPHLLRSQLVQGVAEQAKVSPIAAMYSLVLSLGNMSILDGTTSSTHMQEDLNGISTMRQWAKEFPELWQAAQEAFSAAIDV